MIKLYLKYVEFLDKNIKKLFEELKAIKAMLPKPKPRPPKPKKVKFVTKTFEVGRPVPTPPSPPKISVLSTPTTMKVSVEQVKKNLDYIEDIRREVDHYNRSYINDSVSLTATTLNPSMEGYIKMMSKNPGKNIQRRANKIIEEEEIDEDEVEPEEMTDES